MAINTTPNLDITLQEFNTGNNQWGSIFNRTIVQEFEDVITKKASVNIGIKLSPYNISTDEKNALALELTGILTEDFQLVLPSTGSTGAPINKVYTIVGAWGGAYNVDVKSGGGANLPNAIRSGDIVILYTNGTDITEVSRTPIIAPDGVPAGAIMFWSGSPLNIPTGWKLCDGTLITQGVLVDTLAPDLKDRFVISTTIEDAGVPQTTIAGGLTVSGGTSIASMPFAGGYTGPSGGHSMTIANLPSHQHTYTERPRVNNTEATGGGSALTISPTEPTIGTLNELGFQAPVVALEHKHDINIPQHNHVVSTLSPWYALAYIMKIF